MGDLYFVGSGPVNLGAAAQLCVLALNVPARPRVKLTKISVSFNGVTAGNTPVNAVIAKISNTPAGTSIPTNYGPNAIDAAGPTSLTTALTASTATPGAWTTAPTISSIYWEGPLIPPTSGYPEWFPLGYEVTPAVSTWVGVFLNAPQAVAANTSLLFLE